MELKKYKLADIANIEISGVDKKTIEGETPVRLCNFVDVYYNWAITKEKAKSFMLASAKQTEIDKCSIGKGMVAITKDSETRDDIGIATYIANDFEDVLLGYHCALITPNPAIVDGKYLNAFMHTRYIQKYFENNASGSGQRYTLSNDTIGNIPVLLPSIEVQHTIGKVLSDIDRKIELNKQINDNLETMAKQLYDYWFVQFDFPNEEGKPYKSSGGAMVWNENLKREIPQGWVVEKMGKCTNVLLGGTPDTNDNSLWGNGYNWLNSGEVAEFPILKSEKNITPKGLEKSATVLAPKGSVTLSITRHLRPSILCIDACINQSVVAILENDKVSKEYIYPLLNRDIPRLMSLRTGAQQPHINKETVEAINVILPPANIMGAYINIAESIYNAIFNNAKEVEELTKQRDELLPLLMNGQASVNYHLSVHFFLPLYYIETNTILWHERNNYTSRFRRYASGSD